MALVTTTFSQEAVSGLAEGDPVRIFVDPLVICIDPLLIPDASYTVDPAVVTMFTAAACPTTTWTEC